MNNKMVHMVAFILLVIGGLNLGLNAAFNLDIIGLLGDAASRIVYVLVGLSALYELAMHKNTCKTCPVKAPTSSPTPSE